MDKKLHFPLLIGAVPSFPPLKYFTIEAIASYESGRTCLIDLTLIDLSAALLVSTDLQNISYNSDSIIMKRA
jgi:hypothetical protein